MPCPAGTLAHRDGKPSPGLIFNHMSPPRSAITAVNPSEAGHPSCSASQGVKVGDRVPPRLAPVFMIPGKVPA